MAPLVTYFAGDVWVSTNLFENTTTGAPVDPSPLSAVWFAYSIAGADPVYHQYGNDGIIRRVGPGDFVANIDTTGFTDATTGTVSVQYVWFCNNTSVPGQGVREGVIQVQPPVIPLMTDMAPPVYLESANNLSDVANPATSRTNLGLGTAATHASTDFDAAGAATTAQTNAETFATAAVLVETERAEAQEALKAPLDSPHLTNHPQAPTQPALTNDTNIATTEYADLAVGVERSRAEAAEETLGLGIETIGAKNLKAPVAVVSAVSTEVTVHPPSGAATIDGVPVTSGMRVLLTNQSTTSVDNGIWEANTSGPWVRPSDWAHGSAQEDSVLVAVSNQHGDWLYGSVWQSLGSVGSVDTDGNQWTMIVSSQATELTPIAGASPALYLPTLQFGLANGSLFAYSGNPNTHVVPNNKGDLCVDTSTPSLYQAGVGGNNSSWVQVKAVIDMGHVQAVARNLTQSVNYATNNVAPWQSGQTPLNLVAHEPDYMSDWQPLNVVAAADAIEVLVSQVLISGLWDTVDLNGTIIVWDQTNTNYFKGTWSVTGLNSTSIAAPAAISQVTLRGSDLSLSGTSIVSAAGGDYNVLINTQASWD